MTRFRFKSYHRVGPLEIQYGHLSRTLVIFRRDDWYLLLAITIPRWCVYAVSALANHRDRARVQLWLSRHWARIRPRRARPYAERLRVHSGHLSILSRAWAAVRR